MPSRSDNFAVREKLAADTAKAILLSNERRLIRQASLSTLKTDFTRHVNRYF